MSLRCRIYFSAWQSPSPGAYTYEPPHGDCFVANAPRNDNSTVSDTFLALRDRLKRPSRDLESRALPIELPPPTGMPGRNQTSVLRIRIPALSSLSYGHISLPCARPPWRDNIVSPNPEPLHPCSGARRHECTLSAFAESPSRPAVRQTAALPLS